MKFVNLTPHAVNFVLDDDKTFTVMPSGSVARLTVSTKTISNIDGVPVTTSVFGDVENLPEPKDDTIFIVSSLVASRVPERSGIDVFIPNEAVRDDSGRIVGCRSLGVI